MVDPGFLCGSSLAAQARRRWSNLEVNWGGQDCETGIFLSKSLERGAVS